MYLGTTRWARFIGTRRKTRRKGKYFGSVKIIVILIFLL